jgi:O-antigen/teichoic acid export membrane protein
MAGDADTLEHAVYAVVGGGTALLSHLVKAGSRLAINTSPEPVTNIGASIAEDVTVFALVWFAIEHPRAAAAIAAVLLVVGLVVLYAVARLVRRGWHRWKQRGKPTEDPSGTLSPGPPAP